jgi:hypothetical protein
LAAYSERTIRRVQFVRTDFTGVAERVRREFVLRSRAGAGPGSAHFGKEIAVRADEASSAGVSPCLMMMGSYLGCELKRWTDDRGSTARAKVGRPQKAMVRPTKSSIGNATYTVL